MNSISKFSFYIRFEDQRADFDEYVKFSKDVEQELDMELKQNESKVKEMKSTMSRVLHENETLRVSDLKF
jgi:hypothetical protein